MRALVCQAIGTPPRLTVEEVATPVPRNDEVLVRIHATSINFADSLMLAGKYYVRPEPPFIAGSEFAGVIEAVGKDITGWGAGGAPPGAPPARGRPAGGDRRRR